MISLLSAYQRNRNKLPDKSESVSVRTKRPSTRIDLGQIVTDFPLYLTKCKYLAYQFDFLSLPLSISLSLFFSLFLKWEFLSFYPLIAQMWMMGMREKKKCVWLLSIWKEDAFYLCRSIYMANVWYVFIVLHVDIRFQRLTFFFLPVYSNANGFLLKAGKNAFLHSFRKKTDGKKRSLFYSLSEQPKLIAKSEKGKLYRVMHWCKAFFCNVRLKLLRYLMDILVFHVCKFIHCNVFLVLFSKCIHFSPYIPIRNRYRYACNTIFLFEFLRSVFVVFVLPCLLFHHSTSVAVFIPKPYTHPVNTFGAFPCFIIFLLLLPVYALEYGNSIERIFKVCCANRKMWQICVVSIKANTWWWFAWNRR